MELVRLCSKIVDTIAKKEEEAAIDFMGHSWHAKAMIHLLRL